MAIISHEIESTALDRMLAQSATRPTVAEPVTVSTDWRALLPVIGSDTITLRELRLSDAPTLFAMLSTDEVARFISPPPTTIEGYERFIEWTHRQRAAGQLVCFGIVPHGMTSAIGIFQVRSIEPGFGTAEWGFAMGSEFWGTGAFIEGARHILNFAFEQIGVHRMEARAAVHNRRGNAALQKIGAVREGLLRKAFLKNGTYYDQFLWTVVDSDWGIRDLRL
jgi:ribosomal-protein-alanine N-acetyltransferase